MLKRILTIAAGVFLGMALSLGAVRVAAAWGFWSDRGLDQSTDYVREVLKMVHENYVDPKGADYTGLTQAALRGMLYSLDPHSEYMDARDYAALNDDMDSEFGGIGVQVELRGGKVTVIAPIANTPGSRAGIRHGDVITSIDGDPIKTTALDTVVDRLRGKPGTSVTLGFHRPAPGAEKGAASAKGTDFTVKLTREKIQVDSVCDVRLLPGGIGYLRITQFAERTGDEFIDALNKLDAQNMQALVIDLRDNPGGLLDQAVEVAEPFFKKGDLIVYTQGRDAKDRDEYRSESPDAPLDIPVAVLINQGTASAAEIVSGALKDTHKAVIVGERSFGKGSVQSIIDLRNGDGMRLTTAHYYTPSGVTLNQRGVVPDVSVVLTDAEDQNVAQQYSLPQFLGHPDAFLEEYGTDPLPDRQLDAALAVLKSALILGNDDAPEQPAAKAAATPTTSPDKASTFPAAPKASEKAPSAVRVFSGVPEVDALRASGNA